jgi:hypothetical protein
MLLTTKPKIQSHYVIFFNNGEYANAIADNIKEAINIEIELHPKWEITSASWCGYLAKRKK